MHDLRCEECDSAGLVLSTGNDDVMTWTCPRCRAEHIFWRTREGAWLPLPRVAEEDEA
jgi:predicted RNA-binding Zn-ribbon protein involved in translation (DUF1610 family)